MGLIWAGILLGIGLMLAPLVFRAAITVALMLLYLLVVGTVLYVLIEGIIYYPLAVEISAVVIGVVIWAMVTFCQWADRVQERQARRHEL